MTDEARPLLQPSQPSLSRPLNAARDFLRRNHSLMNDVNGQLERSGLGAEDSPRRNHCSQLTLTVIALSALLIVGFYFIVPSPEPFGLQKMYAKALNVEDIVTHLRALDAIAKEHNDTRAVGAGYNASADYIFSQLSSKAPCTPYTQSFTVPIWTKDAPATLRTRRLLDVTLQEGKDFIQLRYGGETASLSDAPVVEIKGNPCYKSSYSAVRDAAVLIPYPTQNCSLWEAAYQAQKSKAGAVIFRLDKPRAGLPNPRTRITDWHLNDPLLGIPALMVSHSIGNILRSSPLLRVDLSTAAHYTLEPTSNILCLWEGTNRADPNATLVAGAHLDSVPAGHGMVDNASGSSSLLALLLSLHHSGFRPHSRILFAWWGAEEIGLLGSREYVRVLARGEEFHRIRKEHLVGSLNFDMLASPNGIPFVHLGDTAPKRCREGSNAIQRSFETYFEQRTIAYRGEDMYGGSDFLPFLLEGIPSGGVLTGAGQIKTPEEREEHGGLARTPLDPCYHRDCDTLANIDRYLLDVTSHAALWAVVDLGSRLDLRKDLSMDVLSAQ